MDHIVSRGATTPDPSDSSRNTRREKIRSMEVLDGVILRNQRRHPAGAKLPERPTRPPLSRLRTLRARSSSRAAMIKATTATTSTRTNNMQQG